MGEVQAAKKQAQRALRRLETQLTSLILDCPELMRKLQDIQAAEAELEKAKNRFNGDLQELLHEKGLNGLYL